ncbi:pantoate--beta-alanine ligase [Pseudorhodobacter turbinis]|uniref:Pantothenate synthetase n=1 Tax=Pseudorhodobacter turbinis TaxID=2500533 RepID=A0A4P8EHZ2_9RHOB|nr:pantoate--beta-alanine ligase [Pseudorhodobacter turbinis]QCO56596.1 pantoate--beta-alanine ligase [Pseudorhodobacter turbinis]
MPQIVRDVSQLRAIVAGWKAGGDAVGVVPTMGALHEGHLSLVRAAKIDCARVIVTIFVNPKQFNAAEDLQKYPRTEEADAALLAPLGVDVIFAPPAEAVYPPGFATTISVTGISGPLEGAHRPGHFDGMVTVVAKLFGMTAADRAYFGQKDWQQLQVVQRLVADLNLAVKITGCETIREADGLAMSSRNGQLSAKARACAPALHTAMQRAGAAIRGGAPVPIAMRAARAEVLAAGFDEVEYIELRSAVMLERVSRLDGPVRMLAAAMIGGVRLIDNIAV